MLYLVDQQAQRPVLSNQRVERRRNDLPRFSARQCVKTCFSWGVCLVIALGIWTSFVWVAIRILTMLGAL